MVGDTILIKDISINGNSELTNTTELSKTLTDNTINALGIDASSRTIWINGQPYGNAYVNIKEDNTTVEAPIGAEIFNDFEHNTASGDYSHAEGRNTSATGNYSHAEGSETSATGDYSHAGGFYTKTTNTAEAAFGQFNQSTEGSTIFSIGDGDSDSSRHNIVEVTDNNVNINTNLNVEDNLIVGENTTIEGTLDVTGKTTVSTLESSENVNLESLDVTNNTTIGGTLGVTDNTTIGGTLGVTGKTTVSTLESTENAKLESLEVTNNTTIGGTLGITGKTAVSTLESSGNVDLESLDVTNNTTIGGTLGVTGNTTVGGTLGVTGKTTVSTLESTENAKLESLDVTQNTTVGGTLEVNGPTYLRKTVAAGNGTKASGNYSHAEGQSTTAVGTGSHAEGNNTKANGDYSHTTGSHNVAEGKNSTLQGYYLFDHGIDTENSFIWLQCPGEIDVAIVDDTVSPTSEIPGMNQTTIISYGCGYIRIEEQYLTNPEQYSTDKRQGFYRVTGSFFEKDPVESQGWSLKMGINDSYKYYISSDDLTAITTSWDDSGLFLTPEFKIYKYVSSNQPLDEVTTVQGCNWVRTDNKYEQRIQEIGNIHQSSQDIKSIKSLYIHFTPNAQPIKFTNNNATIIGKYNKPRPDNIFEVGCGELPNDMFPIKQRNAISVSTTGKTTITDLNSDNIIANTIKVSETDSSTSNTQLSATSIGVTAFKSENTITKQIDKLPNESSGTLCKTVICCDGILVGYSKIKYMYLTIDAGGNIYLRRKTKRDEPELEVNLNNNLSWTTASA